MSTANVQDGAGLDIVMNGFWGEGQSMHLLLSVFLVHLLHQMQPVPYQLAIRSMKTQRREHVDKGFEKLSMLHLLLWLCQPLVDWLMRQHIFINILLPCSHKWGNEHLIVMGWFQCSLSVIFLLC